MGPEVMALTSIGSSAGGGVLGFMGNLAKGKAESSMYQYQAGVAQFNQKIAEQNRDQAYATGELEAGRYGMKARQTIGGIRSAKAASGLDITSGSASQVADSAHDVAGMDMSTIRSNAARVAYGHTIEGIKYGAEAGMYSAAASNAKKASMINAFGSLLSGATSVSSKWTQARDAGIMGGSNQFLEHEGLYA